jgi:hypothetical protein
VHHLRDEILHEAALGSATSSGQSWYDEVALRRMKEQKDTLEHLLSNTSVHAQRPFQYYTELGARLDARPGQLTRVREELQLLERSTSSSTTSTTTMSVTLTYGSTACMASSALSGS